MTTMGRTGADVTAREADVLALLGQHLTNVQIAETLCISVRTVESHVSALLRKLQLSDRRSLARHHDAESRARAGRRRLPTPLTPFIGRSAERTALAAALVEHRLVTATGPGGVGKTRLAISVAAELDPSRRDGALFVDLVHVTDPEMVVATIAETAGVAEQRAASIEAALVASLAGRDALLVLDNCEHVLDGLRDCIGRILDGCPDVTVLATSRLRLMVAYECVYEVPGLSVTDDGGDAVALFASRVAAATGGGERLDLHRVAALCSALDGMALAIELAAARYSTLGLDGLEAGLEQRLRFLTAGTRTAHRHGSLRDTIGWSYDLLTPLDQALLCSVAVFASWFDVDAAQTVAGSGNDRALVADGLARLADHSLLVVERGRPTRYRALEAIRQYGIGELDSAAELAAVRARHERWCREVTTALAVAEPDDAWCARFDGVVDDVRAALRWSGAIDERRAEAAQLAADVAQLLFLRGRLVEAQRRYEQAASLAPSPAERAGHLRMAAGAAVTRYVGNEALRLLRAAADIAIEIGDRGGAAMDLAWMSMYIDRCPGIMADLRTADEATALRDEARSSSDGSTRAEAAIAGAWTMLSNSAAQPYDQRVRDPAVFEPTRRTLDLARRAGDAQLESAALDELTAVHLAVDDIPGAVRVARHREQVVGTLPIDAAHGFEVLDCLLMASEVSLAAGDLPAAGEHADAIDRLPFFRDEDHLAVSVRLKVDALAGNFDAVVVGGDRFSAGWERAGRPAAPALARASHAVAMVHGMLGDDERRSTWLDITVALGVGADVLAGCATGWAPTFDALLALHRDDPAGAVRRLDADLEHPQVWGFWNTGMWRPWYAALWVEAAVLAGRTDAASRIGPGRHAARANPIAAAMIERAAAFAAGDRDAVTALAVTFDRLGCPYQRDRTAVVAALIG